MRRATAYLEILVFAAGLYWVGCIVRAEVVNRRAIMAEIREEREGWAEHEKQQALAEQYTSWSMTLDPREHMPNTAITDSYNFSCTMGVYNQDLSPLMTSAALKSITLAVPGGWFLIQDNTTSGGWPQSIADELNALGLTPGTDCFIYYADLVVEGCYLPTPEDPDGRCAHWEWHIVSAESDWLLEIPLSIVASHSHIDREERLNVHMGSDAGPTHTNERYFVDTWEASLDAETTYTFGSLQCVCNDPYGMPNPVTPIEFRATLHKAATGTIVYGKWSDIEVSNIDLQLDGIEDPWPGRPTVTVGRGSSLEIEQRDTGWVGDTEWSNHFSPPRMANWSKLGVADFFARLEHDARYDDILVHGNFKKVAYMDGDFTWPTYEECDLAGAGVIPYDSASPVRIGELHALANYVQRYAPYSTWDLVPGYTAEFWSGPDIFLRIDQVSARAHNIPTHAGQYIIMGGPPLNATDCVSDPTFTCDIALADTDFDLSGPLGYRASAWDSADFAPAGGGIGTAGNVAFTVPAGGGTLYRDLIDIWLPRCQFYLAPPAFADFLQASWWHTANVTPAGGWNTWVDYDHDVYDWSAYRHIQFEATATSEPANDPQLRLTYHIPSVTNNHNTPNGWAATASLGPAQSETFSGKYDHTNHIIWFDMGPVGNGEREWLKHVSKAELIFGAESTPIAWTFTQAGRLVKHNANDPDRDEVLPHALTTFHEPRDRYAAGGLRGVVDGLSKYPLCMVEQYNVYSGHEQLVEHINWQFGNPSGLDLSGAWSLAQYMSIISHCTQGWSASLPANWDALTKDSETPPEYLTAGYSFDLRELQDLGVDSGTIDCRFRGWKWVTVPGILYRPWGLEIVQGGLHGLAQKRNGAGGKIYQREAGSGDDWVLIDDEVTSDGHGYWSDGNDVIKEYVGLNPVYWEYRVGGIVIARLYERQWEWDYLVIAGAGKKCGVYTDRDGVTWYVWIAGNDILLKYMTAEYTTFSVAITVDSSGLYDMVDVHGDGRLLVVGARNSGTEAMYSFHSMDMGGTWSGPHLVG